MSGKYKLHNVFIVCIPSNQILLSILGFLIAMGKPIRADALAQSNMVGYPSFGIEPIKKHFLFVRGNILNSKVRFYNKTTSFPSHGCFNKDQSVVTPV